MAKHKIGKLQGLTPRYRKPRGEKILKSGTIELPAGSIPSPSGGKSSAVDFTHALMQGNPLAEAAVAKALAEDEPSLADKFIAETFVERNFPTRLGRRMWDQAMLAYRSDMRKAHRFVVDNEFVALCTQMATTRAEKKLERLQYATLPYEHTWIEFDLHARCASFDASTKSTRQTTRKSRHVLACCCSVSTRPMRSARWSANISR